MRSALALVGILSLVAAAGAAAATPPDVSRLILRASQVGPGFVMFQLKDGRGVKANATLNLCGHDYPSESLRLTRLQTDYVPHSGTLGISNEVVTYRQGGAAQAMREVAQHADHCPKGLIGGKGEPKLRFAVSRIHDAHLLPGYVAVRILASGVVNGKSMSQVSFAVYQRRGDVFSGVYSFDTKNGETAQLRLCLHAAEQSAHNLRKGNGAPSGPAA